MWWSSGPIEGLEVVVLRRSVMNGRKARLSRVSSRALNSPAAPTTGSLRDSLDTSRRHDWTAPGSYVLVHGVACSRCPTTRSFGQVGSFATGGAAASEKSATRTPVTGPLHANRAWRWRTAFPPHAIFCVDVFDPTQPNIRKIFRPHVQHRATLPFNHTLGARWRTDDESLLGED
jgi:hypothetical protein